MYYYPGNESSAARAAKAVNPGICSPMKKIENDQQAWQLVHAYARR
jgi:hypothetical protein